MQQTHLHNNEGLNKIVGEGKVIICFTYKNKGVNKVSKYG